MFHQDLRPAAAPRPVLSIILVDWSCRESFHALDYLARQDAPRERYEVIWVEFYARRPAEIGARLEKARAAAVHPPLDQWIVLGMPDDLYYHKHLMYNVGLAFSRGTVVAICDSDAVFTPGFVGTVIEAFAAADDGIVLHLDQVRNASRAFYPFNYPSIEALTGPGATNWRGTTTTGLLDLDDPLHSRNYGACMCARRADLVAIGGADEHIDYLGHICGPYEMTFRLANKGLREEWHAAEFLYHTWHPGQSGHDNYVGPHDGRHMSRRALSLRQDGRVLPFVENAAVRRLREGRGTATAPRPQELVDGDRAQRWRRAAVARSHRFGVWHSTDPIKTVAGYDIVDIGDLHLYAIPRSLGRVDLFNSLVRLCPQILCARSMAEIEAKIAEANAPPRPVTPLGRHRGYRLFGYRDRVYAVPRSAGRPDLTLPWWRTRADVLVADDRGALEQQIDAAMRRTPVEYLGWLPVIRHFGECGSHPQFAHLATPPPGYRFTRSAPAVPAWGIVPGGGLRRRLLLLGHRLRHLPVLLRMVPSLVGLSLRAVGHGASLAALRAFLRSRELRSQLLLRRRIRLGFLPSVPYTFGQYPWMLQVEDPISLFFPFVRNGETTGLRIDELPVFPVLAALIESPRCRGIVTHMRDTAEALPVLFGNPALARKVYHVPLGVPARPARPPRSGETTNLLFSGSWHQDPASFYARGGLEVLGAYRRLRRLYPRLRLILRSPIPPDLPAELGDLIVEDERIRLLRDFLSAPDWRQVIDDSDILVLPAARIHAVSLLEAMAAGLAAVVSDGWGFEEYVEDGVTALVCRGRHGKASWMEAETGILREDYAVMRRPDRRVTDGLVEAVERLIEDPELGRRLGAAARQAVETRFNLENWNRGLKRAFDAALAG